jgi:molybdopterin-guanine dinucleotide biosynthesis adapter protein
MRVIGLAGWSGSGKTRLVSALIPVLTARGLRVSTVKHAHHAFDVDTPGKDSWTHRQAGATEVLVSSATRWALMHEHRGEAETPLSELLKRLSPCDLVLVEGFKRAPLPKIEVYRAVVGKPPLHAQDPGVKLVASDDPCPQARVPVLSPDDLPALADAVLSAALPVEDVIATLEAVLIAMDQVDHGPTQ